LIEFLLRASAHYMARVVLPPQKRKGHVRLDLCTSGSGEWQRHIMSRSKAGTLGYRAARKAHWVDC
jgi:ribosomal protein RSM22 (predicted rRNA methylase)